MNSLTHPIQVMLLDNVVALMVDMLTMVVVMVDMKIKVTVVVAAMVVLEEVVQDNFVNFQNEICFKYRHIANICFYRTNANYQEPKLRY